MRVLLTTDTVGGVWTFTQSLTQELLARRDEVYLVSFGRAPLPWQQEWVQTMRSDWDDLFTYEASSAPLEWMDGNSDAFCDGAAVLHRVAHRFEPDIVHASQFCWGALDLPVPIVLTAHSDVLSWADACRPEGIQDSKWLQTYVRLVTDGLGKAAAVAAPTRWMLDALKRNFTFSGWAGVVMNGTAVPLFRTDSTTRMMRALCVGRLWDEGKGLGILAERDWPIPVVVAGEDRFENGPRMQVGQVETLGQLSRLQIEQEMKSSAIYLCTSIYEPFGLSAVEAGVCGCAVVCRDIESLREVWGESALYFSDADMLRAVLLLLSHNAVLLERMQSAAFVRARRYSIAEMTNSYRALYEDQLELSHA